jgi:hypothetical protein
MAFLRINSFYVTNLDRFCQQLNIKNLKNNWNVQHWGFVVAFLKQPDALPGKAPPKKWNFCNKMLWKKSLLKVLKISNITTVHRIRRSREGSPLLVIGFLKWRPGTHLDNVYCNHLRIFFPTGKLVIT